nr:nucleotidyltransferase family protein [Sphingopyxis panaciterrae]
MAALAAVAALRLPDCWIGAGFVRDAVWDYRHGRQPVPPFGDVDVLWFAPDASGKDVDRDIERQLRVSMPDMRWSVKNQARMHRHNGDTPYHSVADAMTHWPETATAVAARLENRRVEICAPLGLDDLFALRVRPTAAFRLEKRGVFDERISSKCWVERYPSLVVLDD